MKKIIPQPKIVYLLLVISILALSVFTPVRGVAAKNESAQAANTVFAVIGDYGLASQNEADVANLVKSWNPNFIVTVGDNNYEKGLAETIDQNIGQYYHDYIFRYTGKYGSGSPTNRFFPALGNHDWGNNGIKPYLDYFTLPGNERYYDFVGGSIHFFIIDSDTKEPDETSATGKQARWLKNGLAASTSPFNIVVLHHAPYSSGAHGSNGYMQWPFKTWGAHAVLSGHDHIYERLIIDGLPYFVNGLGGDDKYNYGTTVPGSQIRFNQDFGAMRVEASNTSVKFQFYTRANILVDEYTISKSIPVVTSILRSGASPTNAASVNYTVNFSESVSGVDVSDFLLRANGVNGASITNLSGSGSSYTVSVNTGSGSGTLYLDLIDNDSILNGIGNTLGGTGTGNGNYINGEFYAIEKPVLSVVSIVRASANPTNAANVNFTVTFSNSVNGVDISDFIPATNGTTGAAVSSVNGSGNIYSVLVSTPSSSDTLRLDLIDNDSIADATGNLLGGAGVGNGNFYSGESYTIDRSAPGVVSIVRANANPTNAASVDFVVNFSEPVLGLDISDFTLNAIGINGASISNISGQNTSYIVTVNTGSNSGTLRLDLVNNNSIVDLIGNPLAANFANGEIYNIEKSIPSVLSIVRANSNPTNANTVDFIATFSASVSGVDVSDFNLSTTGINNASIVGVSGSANIYIVSVQTGFGDGSIRLDLVDNDSIVNRLGAALGDLGSGNGNFTSGETYSIDKTAPIITSIIRSGANPSNSPSVDFIVTFSESVTGVDGSDFNLNAGNINSASIIGVNPSDPFYIVSSSTGYGSGNLRLDLTDDDSITDAAGNKLGGFGTGNGSFINGENFTIEKSAPSVTSIISTGQTSSNASSVDFIVTFSESVTGVDASDFSINAANIINASITAVNNFDPFYVVTVNTGMGTGSIRLDLIDNDSIINKAGASLGSAGAGNGNFTNGTTVSISKMPVNFSPPTLREPQRNFLTNIRNPTFSWSKVRDASAYEIAIASDSGFSQIINKQVVNALSYTSNIALNDGVYYWRVQAYNSSFQPGKFSVSNSFTVDTTPPTVPVLIAPVNNSNASNRLKFLWEKVSAATRYQIEIDNNSDFSSPEWSTLRQEPNFQIFTFRSGIYFWRVRAKDMAGNWSGWSAVNIFNIP